MPGTGRSRSISAAYGWPEDISELEEWEDLTDICLVAWSYGGYPASGALERIGNRVSSIVWVDALKPSDGQSFQDEVPFKVEDGAISLPAPKAVRPDGFHDPKDAAWYLSKVTPQPIGPWLQPVKLSGARERVAKRPTSAYLNFRWPRWTRRLPSARQTSLGRS
jgi:Alpha/beta hydrolase family